jgi:hypothetical protein
MKRIAVPVAALAIAVAAMAGCSKNDTTSTTATTAAQASSGDKATTTAGSETKSSTSEKKGATTSTKPAKDGESSSSITIPGNVSIPGGDVNKTLGDAQKCIDMATAYTGLFTPLIGGQVSNADKAKIQSALDDMKNNVPSSIADDIETIESGLNGANSVSDVAEFLSSDKFNTANDAITTYLTTECQKVGK